MEYNQRTSIGSVFRLPSLEEDDVWRGILPDCLNQCASIGWSFTSCHGLAGRLEVVPEAVLEDCAGSGTFAEEAKRRSPCLGRVLIS